MSSIAENVSPNCQGQGAWTVSDGTFTGTIHSCLDVTFTFPAPAVRSDLNGSWGANTGEQGTFRVTRP
jgi:hypothetical protein